MFGFILIAYCILILMAKILFNVFKKWGFSYLASSFWILSLFLKGIGGYFAPFLSLRNNAF
ncbi:hypothetical protein FIM34_00745 [Helicobacter pylori]|nr:hypothetical protein FIM34_00745 [Helicobacter pylori]